jgi:alkanesulfonate monooxygenase SsuD/methylene tetrahydromethanopterin reductase-like flavin-dependent oxidoreductase (luciferase family)
MAENLALSGLAIDQAAIIDCVSRRDLDGAARRVPDEAVEAFAVAGSLKRCGERAEAFFAAGIDELLINVGSTAAEREAALALIRAVNG